jgi:serine/threonine protein kinase
VPAPLPCPELASWEALFAEEFPPEEQERYARHLEVCPVCQERLDRGEVCREAWRHLGRRHGDPTLLPPEPQLLQVLARLHEATGCEPGSAGRAVDLDFLRPGDRPGVLGTLGKYEVEEVIGQGGMGIVLKAFDATLHRHVALKVLSPALAVSATARRRFTREAQAAAVRHEHIVAVHGVAEADGVPYLVMQYVAGESLQARLDRAGPLDVAEVVRIGLQVASGLAAAHAQGLIHRDIKPANILLECRSRKRPACGLPAEPASGPLAATKEYVKITDFGLARAVDDVGLTRSGVVAGTPEYMAPEQARGEDIDHRADLFSFGSVLYALCTGRPPFRGPTAVAVLRQVRDAAPTPIRSLNPAVPAWLEALVARLHARGPAERFQSAAEVAALLEDCLAHLRQPATVPAPLLTPHADGSAELPAGKGGRGIRPRALLLVLAGLATLGSGLLLWLVAADVFRTPAGQAAPEPPADALDTGVWTLAFSPDGKRLATGGGGSSRPGQFQIWDVPAGKPLVTRRAQPGVRAVAYSPDGQTLATGHWGGDIRLRDPLTGQERATLTGHTRGVNGLAFSTDGTLLASAGLDSRVKLWDVKAARERPESLGHPGMVFSVAFFHSGRALVTGGNDRTARVWDLDNLRERLVLQGHSQLVETVAVSPDDRVVATGSWDKTIKLWDAANGQEIGVLRPEGGWVLALAFCPNGNVLASAGADGRVHLWDVASGKSLQNVAQHQWFARALAWSPDGKLLASGGEDRTVHLWDVAAGRDVAVLSPAAAEESPDAPEGAAPRTRSKGWLAAGVLLSLLLALTLAVWLTVRSRRAPAGDERAGPDAAPAFLPCPCPGCGKVLKAKATLAGRKVRCSGCGQVIVVPATTPD